jgi:type I restriction enzyme S subunit
MVEVIIDNLDVWSSALLTKSTSGRGSNGKLEAYGIKKLRELILELAVRGKLVPQDPNDEPASVLLERIVKEKSRLIREGLIKKEKSFSEIGDDEKSFELPDGWEWSRLQDVSSYVQRGKGPRYADFGKVQVVSQKCIQWAGFDLSQARYVDDASLYGYQAERFLCKDDLLWNSTGTGTAGRINVVPDVESNSLVADSHVTIIRPLMVSSSFLRCYVAAPGIQQRIEPEHENSLVSGTTNQVELNLSAVVQLVVPVPPLAEQYRIVAKVDELMALCDQLEQQQTDSLAAHQTLVASLLGTLIRVESQQEFSAAWARIASHFDTLFTTEASIDQLKQTILQLAVMGKLVPQDPNDEPVSDLLKRIATERGRLVEDGEARQKKVLPDIGKDEVPYVLPKGWGWVRLGQIISISSGDGLTSANMKSAGGIPVYGGNGVNGYHDKANITKPTLVIGRVGYYCGSIHITPELAWVTDNAFVTTFSEENIYLGFLYWLLRGTNLKENENATAQPVISGRKVYPIVVGLPPKKEQHRIVAKVDELMAMCDTLKARLAEAHTIQLHLADAIVEQAVG